MFYLLSDAVHEAAKQGLIVSRDTINLAVKKGELKAIVTPRGVKIIAQVDLDQFIEHRKAKKLATISQSKKAA